MHAVTTDAFSLYAFVTRTTSPNENTPKLHWEPSSARSPFNMARVSSSSYAAWGSLFPPGYLSALSDALFRFIRLSEKVRRRIHPRY